MSRTYKGSKGVGHEPWSNRHERQQPAPDYEDDMTHPDQKYGDRTWAQSGEDLFILNLVTLLGFDHFSWLDLGCHHPSNISNTKLFYDRGYRGVNVDANQKHIDLFKKERPEDHNVCVGVAAESGIRDFYMYDDYSGRNTFSFSETTEYKEKAVVSVQRLPVVTINQIVDQDCQGIFPDLLSIDLEGLDYEVLKSASFMRSRPVIIVVETRHNTKSTEDMIALLIIKDYTLISRLGENLIFLQNSFYETYLFGRT